MEETSIGSTVAQLLLESGAVHVSSGKPFILRSGWASPVYVDVRRLISSVAGRKVLVDAAQAVVRHRIGVQDIDAIAGAETAGVPYAAWLADRLSLPLLIVRKKPLGFGRNAQIEGMAQAGARVLLVDDLTTDGQSKRNFCKAVRDSGLELAHVLSIFYYDTFVESRRTMEEIGVTMHALATWQDIIAQARTGTVLTAADIEKVEGFLLHTSEWSKAHGGISRLP
ncbi:orotate phosphoribosyltransferase [Pigmentiphaga sp. GD03639]|uniref:Orotate phosphoribosyltransferase n=1 Tax=Pigmentiphaga daeguensis TaxID=414049 RepID=A0ABN1CA56_9BURK|nr:MULTISPECIES: orotate phosphoribosyltransferase [unclassified Pigmentiphaga]MDH2237427.1 orotate phosphoribosyltransferase [Pigmentiphaga sp. GD03639]OVZ63129.1 orotate phosphoribosyltransferase [Pigmentiphaga sp. NML030171]